MKSLFTFLKSKNIKRKILNRLNYHQTQTGISDRLFYYGDSDQHIAFFIDFGKPSSNINLGLKLPNICANCGKEESLLTIPISFNESSEFANVGLFTMEDDVCKLRSNFLFSVNFCSECFNLMEIDNNTIRSNFTKGYSYHKWLFGIVLYYFGFGFEIYCIEIICKNTKYIDTIKRINKSLASPKICQY